MRYYWDLVKHFLLANSRHGTHSPFVYKLADEVIYQKSSNRHTSLGMPANYPARCAPLLRDILIFLELKDLSPLASKGGTLSSTANKQALWIAIETIPAEQVLELLAQGYVLVVDEPYRTGRAKAAWYGVCANPAVTVAIDLFHFGILMQRAEQRKETFRLRYPYRR